MQSTTLSNHDNALFSIKEVISEFRADQPLDHCIKRRNGILRQFHKIRTQLLSQEDDIHLYYFDKEIAPVTKFYLLFLRDTMLELHKAKVKLTSGTVNENEWREYTYGIKDQMDTVTHEYLQNIEKKWKWILNFNNEKSTKLESTLVTSPGNVYKRQIDLCGKQMTRIKSQDLEMSDIVLILNDIREDLRTHLEIYIDQEKSLESLLTKLIDELNGGNDVENALKETQSALLTIPLPTGEELDWVESLDQKMSTLPQITMIINHQEGLLVEKNFNLSKGTQKWVDMILLPKHIQLRDKVEQNLNRVSTMLINARHKYQLLDGKKNKIYHDEIISTIFDLSKSQKEITTGISEEYKNLINNSTSMLRGDQLFLDNSWMASSFDLSLGQFKSDTENIFKKVYLSCKNNISRVAWIPFIHSNDELNKTEKIAKLIQAKTQPEQLGHYQRVFMSDGFLSDYFLVERSHEMAHVDSLFELWNDDFGVSLILTGLPHCGKTTFALQILQKHWPDNHIFLKPNTSLEIGDKQIKITANLKDAFEKITSSFPPSEKWCIVIDDVHKWHDDTTSLLKNMDDLRTDILGANPHIMIIAIMDLHLLYRLQMVSKFEDAFMSQIDLSTIAKKEFLTTLGHRHDATQNDLYGHKSEPLTDRQIKVLGERIWRYSEKNIGTSLNEWINSVTYTEGGKWNMNFKALKYPKVLNKTNAGIYNAMMIHTEMDENRLTSITDHMDHSIQQSFLNNMMNSKVLHQDIDSVLTLNSAIVTHVHGEYHTLDEYEYESYVIASDEINGNVEDAIWDIKLLLFNYPYLSYESEVSFILRKNKMYISLTTMELPSAIIDYLNDRQSNYHFQFIKRTKIKS